MVKGKWTVGQSVGHVKRHEAMHTMGDAPRGFVCPAEGCDFAHPTSALAVWEHAEAEHELERDAGRCLWDGCGFGRKGPLAYVRHEPQHTGVWPYACAKCGKGYKDKSGATVCCQVFHKCNCGREFRGIPQRAKRDWGAHQKKCKAGAAPIPVVNTD
jgi:hypothetical protein